MSECLKQEIAIKQQCSAIATMDDAERVVKAGLECGMVSHEDERRKEPMACELTVPILPSTQDQGDR
jgi:hypothetical protein